jgi:hypothetical protein
MKVFLVATLIALSTACNSRSRESTVKTPLMPGEVFLSGKKFSRTFESKVFGAPEPIKFTHTIFFVDSTKVQDNGSQFFGNPPEVSPFRVKANEIIIGEVENPKSVYILNDDWTKIENKETGAILILE